MALNCLKMTTSSLHIFTLQSLVFQLLIHLVQLCLCSDSDGSLQHTCLFPFISWHTLAHTHTHTQLSSARCMGKSRAGSHQRAQWKISGGFTTDRLEKWLSWEFYRLHSAIYHNKFHNTGGRLFHNYLLLKTHKCPTGMWSPLKKKKKKSLPSLKKTRENKDKKKKSSFFTNSN